MNKKDFMYALNLENNTKKTDYDKGFIHGIGTTFAALKEPNLDTKTKAFKKKKGTSTAFNLRCIYYALGSIIVLGLCIIGLLTYYLLTNHV
ncbi:MULTISPECIES: hypothetical protein [unclassified Polaribacter]|uniref:hypothetical protein n=1 Tax=unclassified Polaribacter TaxID=196858 RepID=UPI0011BEB432|nr:MULTISPECIES: hypothetical protein [unclassified Polaribacter]TXD49567.1 hypothetical protein ES043_17230 [Polaribacter sp. IC063]TXD56207.1 hypothetical protein ES044_17260 [Polaribacter sp. IC066]